MALENLRNIRQHYLEVGGKALALRMVRSIRKEAAKLADNPHIAPPYEMTPGLRRLVVAKGSFLVFYRVVECVEVVHVRRAERDPVVAGELLGQ